MQIAMDDLDPRQRLLDELDRVSGLKARGEADETLLGLYMAGGVR